MFLAAKWAKDLIFFRAGDNITNNDKEFALLTVEEPYVQ